MPRTTYYQHERVFESPTLRCTRSFSKPMLGEVRGTVPHLNRARRDVAEKATCALPVDRDDQATKAAGNIP
jgi:hypothetical protein